MSAERIHYLLNCETGAVYAGSWADVLPPAEAVIAAAGLETAYRAAYEREVTALSSLSAPAAIAARLTELPARAVMAVLSQDSRTLRQIHHHGVLVTDSPVQLLATAGLQSPPSLAAEGKKNVGRILGPDGLQDAKRQLDDWADWQFRQTGPWVARPPAGFVPRMGKKFLIYSFFQARHEAAEIPVVTVPADRPLPTRPSALTRNRVYAADFEHRILWRETPNAAVRRCGTELLTTSMANLPGLQECLLQRCRHTPAGATALPAWRLRLWPTSIAPDLRSGCLHDAMRGCFFPPIRAKSPSSPN